jgi:hypothetical protein
MNSIHDICKEYDIENYTINSDGSIDVAGDVDLYDKGLTEIPLVFNKVTGYFSCTGNYLTTLKGSPKWVGGWFSCNKNQLTSLKGCPRWVGGWFSCGGNRLTSLEFSPDYVGGWFDCRWNNLTNNYCETEIGSSFCTSLEQDGLTNNYNEWRKLYKRKLILNDIFNM